MEEITSRVVLKGGKCHRSIYKKAGQMRRGCSVNASRINHLAVSLVQADQPDQALICIKRGLRHILHSLLKSTTIKQQHLSIVSQVAPAIKINEEQLVSPDGIFAFYNNVLLIRGSSSDESVIPLLLYNLGLIYHRRAIELGSSPRLLRAALRMYQQAQKFGGPDVLAFALMNNSGHALSCLFDYEAIKSCQLYFAANRHRYRKLVSPEGYCILQPNITCAPMA